jgi:hypothetical protein
MQVGLGQDDHRARPAFPGHRQVALEAPDVQLAAERGDQEDRVDVRRDDLFARPVGHARCLLAREQRAARQDVVDRPRAVGAEIGCHPVADGRMVDRVGVVAQPAGPLGAVLAERRQQAVQPVALRGDARGVKPRGAVRRERRLEVVAPAELVEPRRGRGRYVQLVLLSSVDRARALARARCCRRRATAVLRDGALS